MTNYSWIKPGVQAIITGVKSYPDLLGRVVTISGYPSTKFNPYTNKEWFGVEIEEGFELAKEVCPYFAQVTPACSCLMPLKGDDEQFKNETKKEKPVHA